MQAIFRAIFLIDGEHYPPVVVEAIEAVKREHGAEPVAAVFLGGTEKIKGGAYADYVRRTSGFFPRPPRRG